MRKIFALLSVLLVMPSLPAWAEEPINIDIGTPPVIIIRHAMTQRYSRLVRMYDAGIIGLGTDGMLQKRDTGKQLTLPLHQPDRLQQLPLARSAAPFRAKQASNARP